MSASYFTLEVLNAAHGDCLLLHYGTEEQPLRMLIDGGPVGTYTKVLAPRLGQLHQNLGGNKLRLAHTVVTHLDSDHIAGVLNLAQHIQAGSSAVACKSFWFNAFQDGLTMMPPELAQAQASLGRNDAQAVAAAVEHASIAEGQQLRDLMKPIGAKVNAGAAFLLAPLGGLQLPFGGNLQVTLVCPSQTELQALAKEWIAKAKPSATESAAYVDRSVFNLSSLVMVIQATSAEANCDRPRMLLTGDARGDHILAGLEAAGLLDAKGKVTFDILKVPHHGSRNNLSAEFFQRVRARYYILSADGRHDNPDADTMNWLAAAIDTDADAQVWLTNESSDKYPALQSNIAAAIAVHPKLKKQLRFRASDQLSFKIDLLDQVTW